MFEQKLTIVLKTPLLLLIQVHMDKNHSNGKSALKISAPQKRKKTDFVYEESSSKNETPVVLLVECKFCNHKFKFMSQLGEEYNQKCPMCPRYSSSHVFTNFESTHLLTKKFMK